MIPGFLRRRLTPLRSIKDIASNYIRPSHQRTLSEGSDRSTESIQPPPPYSEDPPSSDDEDMDEYASASSSRPSSSGTVTPMVDMTMRTAGQTKFTEDLVRFKFANQGLLLVAQSAQELRTNPNANNEYQRRLYLDGVAYLLRALPEGLSETERAGLHSALPPTLREETPRPIEQEIERDVPASKHSILSAIVSIVVFWSFFVFATALPHVKMILRRLYALERKHRLLEQCLAQGLALLQMTYTQLIAVSCALWAFNDGMIGKMISALSMWCAQHVGEGVSEGLRDAAAALRRQQDTQQRS